MKLQNFIAGLMAACALLVAAWMLLAHRSRAAYQPYELTPADFADFQPVLAGWVVHRLPSGSQAEMDANIVAFRVEEAEETLSPPRSFLVRLVHGYNMPMCMKIKQYKVEKILDYKVRATADPKLRSAFTDVRREEGVEEGFTRRREGAKNDTSGKHELAGRELEHQKVRDAEGSAEGGSEACGLRSVVPSNYPVPIQLWRLTSSVGDVSCWVTTMIRSGDFAPTDTDICTMAFPRVDMPDDPNWIPRGFGREDLRHPVVAFRRWKRERWDAARWDLLTFLRLRRPERGSEELLSYMTIVGGDPAEGIEAVLDLHFRMLDQFRTFTRPSCNQGEM